VAEEHKNRGYGIVLWSELVRRAQAAGYDGMMNYCVDGDPMNDMIVGACHRIDLPVERVYSVHYLSKMLFPTPAAGVAGVASVDAFLSAAAGVTARTPLARIWTEAEAEWQYTRPGAVRSAGAGGLLTGYVQPVANRERAGCLIVDDVLWNSAAVDEQAALTRQLTSQAARAGARLAVVPFLGYADAQPFIESGFRPSQRVVHAYLTLWGDSMKLEPVSSLYLDVV
jgi:hypothetical protein